MKKCKFFSALRGEVGWGILSFFFFFSYLFTMVFLIVAGFYAPVIYGSRVVSFARADIVFIIDASDSTGEENFKKGREFIRDYINPMKFDDDLARYSIASIISYYHIITL